MYAPLYSALFTITEVWMPPKCPSTGEWINKMRHFHTMEYYSAKKRNEVLIHATTWMNLENIRLSERGLTPKTTYLWVYLYEMPRKGKSIETESRLVAGRSWGDGVGNGEWLLMGRGFLLERMKSSGLDCGDSCFTLWIY